MKSYKINCDVGEGVGNESELMPFIQYCNIACGGHTGDSNSMNEIVEIAIQNNVLIGAHPSYPDRVNFGRKTMQIFSEELIGTIQSQIESLLSIVKSSGTSLFHIKPHGALYNDIAKNKLLALTFLEAIKPYKFDLKLFVPYKSVIEEKAIENGFSIIYEVFADRNYNDDLSLVSRNQKNSMIVDSVDVIQHVSKIIESGKVTTITNKKVAIKANTFCVHSDTDNAVLLVKELNKLIIG